MIRNILFALSIIGISTLSAACPNCNKSAESGEVRVRGVLQKKPSSTVSIHREESAQDNERKTHDESSDKNN